MIGADVSAASSLVAKWRRNIDWDTAISARDASSLEHILTSATAPAFPGGILPWPRIGKQTIYYGATRSPQEWRRLRPLLVAFAGPTLTNFTGVPSKLNPKWGAAEMFLASNGFTDVARLVPIDDPNGREQVRSALDRLCRIVLANPIGAHRPNDPTSRLVGRLQGALADRDRASAISLFARLRADDRLDALNLRYLSIEISSAFRDWAAIADMPELVDLVAAPRPAAVTSAVLEALYNVRVAPAQNTGKVAEVLSELAPMLTDLLAKPRPKLGIGAARLAELMDSAAAPSSDATLQSQEEHEPSALAEFPRDEALERLVRAMRSDSLESYRDAFAAVEALAESERELLLAPTWVREMWRAARQRVGDYAPPRNWPEWLTLLPIPEFRKALDVARAAAAEWAVGEQLADPDSVSLLADKLLTLPEGIAAERLDDALPVLIGWLKQDPEFPRPAFLPVYDALWTLLVLGMRSGHAFESSATLFDGLLGCRLRADRYKLLLQDALDIAQEPGRRTAYWIFGLVESTAEHPAADAEARESFWVNVLARIERFRSHLTTLQCAAVNRLARTLGMHEVAPAVDAAGVAAVDEALKDQRIAIYTLTESAARQAAETLSYLAPTLRISLHSDHGGSQPLKSAAENADIFVVVTWSATHAATDFIREHRPRNKPLLYAPGRGATSILRVIDEYLAK